jgi:hypothetical protein
MRIFKTANEFEDEGRDPLEQVEDRSHSTMTETEYRRKRAKRLRELYETLQNEVAKADKNIQISKDELATALKELALVEAEAAYRGVALDKSSL